MNHNLAAKPAHASQKAALVKRLPDDRAYPAPSAGVSGVLRKEKQTP